MQANPNATPAKANSAGLPGHPREVLLLKGHSAGIGDLLRSSAAWRVLHNAWPDARLHLWFLTKDPGAPAESLIARHHLLASFHVSDKRTGGLAGWRRLLREAGDIAGRVRPDLVLDFEPNGLRTSLLTWRLGRRSRARTAGIAQVPGRRAFYHLAAPSTQAYARAHGLPTLLEYCERDFVVLAALGLERQGTAIELTEMPEGRAFRAAALHELGGLAPGRPWLGVNVGCGTPDAAPKRPDLALLAALVGELHRQHGFAVLLTGAPNEQDINRAFRSQLAPAIPVLDCAGRTSLRELTGAIAVCRLFISSDSGPYHMAVALRVPTLALFNFPNPEHYHHHPWVACEVAPEARALPAALAAAQRLLALTPPPVPS
jgi:ADP-heptose:LPS heptosyltransferase